MNRVLQAFLRPMPNKTRYRAAGGVAFASAALTLAFVTFVHPYLGIVVGYVVVPLFAALLVWVFAAIVRLRLVGFLPSEDADRFIPTALAPWIRFWMLARFGLLGAMLLLVLAIAGTALVGGPITYPVEAFVYVAIVRIFMDVTFGAVFNLGIISRRDVSR